MQKETPDPKRSNSKIKERCNLQLAFLFIAHFLGLLVFVNGIVFRKNFHNGDECQMTYSMREFMEIANPFEPTSPVSKMYKLYKFIDRRDPRYQSLLHSKQPLSDNLDWCGNSRAEVKVVLFIPGHWGSYSQSRSLGAHGLKLTGRSNDANVKTVVNALEMGELSGDTVSMESFIYEVFSVDFDGQGAALHGHFLRSQSQYVSASVEYISQKCKVNAITLVGHSMGGVVARLVPSLLPENRRRLVQDIITLASPHSNPVYGFDYSIHEVYEDLDKIRTGDVITVSVCAGLKDEMIEPSSTFLAYKSSLSVSARDILDDGEFGMDHQAITWCFDVLNSVRGVIWTLSRVGGEGASTRLRFVEQYLGKDSSTFHYQSTGSLREKFGPIHAKSIEAGMTYNIPQLLTFFCMLGWLRCLSSSEYHSFNILLTAICGWSANDLSAWSTLVLTLVANIVHTLISLTLPVGFCINKSIAAYLFISQLAIAIFTFLLFPRQGEGPSSPVSQFTDSHLFLFLIDCILCCLFLIVGFCRVRRNRDLSFVSMALIATVVSGIGPFSLILCGGKPEATNWYTMILISLSVASYFLQQRSLVEQDMASTTNSCRYLYMCMGLISVSKWLLARGHGYRVVFLLPAVVASNFVRTLPARGQRGKKNM